jgi:hypothetical protein
MKVRAVGAEFFHAVGQTDVMKLTVALYGFPNTPKSRVATSQKTHCVSDIDDVSHSWTRIVTDVT